MKALREFRANPKAPEERARENAIRDRLQETKPSLETLIQSGESDPDAVMTMGMYFDVQRAIQGLKQDRKRSGISIGEVAEKSGLDRAVVSRLENGKQDNPTVATLMRYAAAIGKRFLWSFENLANERTGRNGKATRPRTSKRPNRVG